MPNRLSDIEPSGAVFERLEHRLELIERRLGAIEDRLADTRREYYRVGELAELLRRSEYTVRRWIAEKKLTALRVEGSGPRGTLLVSREQVETLIQAGKVEAVPGLTTRN